MLGLHPFGYDQLGTSARGLVPGGLVPGGLVPGGLVPGGLVPGEPGHSVQGRDVRQLSARNHHQIIAANSPVREERLMSEKKPTPVFIEKLGKVCPVCRKTSYSRDGIHPQCAATQSDEPRRLRLAAEKKAAAETKKLEKDE